MIEVISEFVVIDADRGQFELVFGRGGAWGKLFDRCPGYRGTSLLRDVENPLRYLIIDIWDSPEVREDTLAETESDYSKLLATMSEWTMSKTELGTFRLQAEGTVQPMTKTRRKRRQ